jgi:putative transposase
VLIASFMFRPYSLDLRERAVALLDEGATSVEVADLLDVSDSWVRKMRLRREALGHLIPGSPPGKERLLSEDQEEQLCLLVFEQPDATLEELVALMAKRMKVRASISTVSRRLIEMGMSRKKRVSTRPKRTAPRSNESASASFVEGSSGAPRDCSSSTKRGSTSR